MIGYSTGEFTYRVVWLPGTDRLLGVCHCGARHIAEDPVSVWAWLVGHPDGHLAEPIAAQGSR